MNNASDFFKKMSFCCRNTFETKKLGLSVANYVEINISFHTYERVVLVQFFELSL